MFTLIKQLYTKYCGYPQYNIAILGLQRTGKTQILKALKDEVSPYMVGINQEYRATIASQVQKKKTKFLVWDLGGKSSFRKLWEHYYSECHGVVFVFDDRIYEGFQCLKSLMSHPQMSQIPILVYVRSGEHYSRIQQQLQKLKGNEMMINRAVDIELLPNNRIRLYQNLEGLYQNIYKVDMEIRK